MCQRTSSIVSLSLSLSLSLICHRTSSIVSLSHLSLPLSLSHMLTNVLDGLIHITPSPTYNAVYNMYIQCVSKATPNHTLHHAHYTMHPAPCGAGPTHITRKVLDYGLAHVIPYTVPAIPTVSITSLRRSHQGRAASLILIVDLELSLCTHTHTHTCRVTVLQLGAAGSEEPFVVMRNTSCSTLTCTAARTHAYAQQQP